MFTTARYDVHLNSNDLFSERLGRDVPERGRDLVRVKYEYKPGDGLLYLIIAVVAGTRAGAQYPCSKGAGVTITTDHDRSMAVEGFCVLEEIFSVEEMEDLARLIERHQARHEADLASKGGTAGISRAKEITFTSHLAEQDPGIMAFCRRLELISIATHFLGGDVDLYWNQSVYKMPQGMQEFPWHQDDGYTPVTPSPYLTIWLAINDATPENGCISALPGSHLRGLVAHEQTPLGLACHSGNDPDQGIRVPIRAGSAAVFWSLTMHKSGANVSADVRKAYIIQYSKAGLKSLRTGNLVEQVTPMARNGNTVL
jgi:ectoine hydroxylase-related dioxygenase (phytanoyl-CoA dioxygenase family)